MTGIAAPNPEDPVVITARTGFRVLRGWDVAVAAAIVAVVLLGWFI